MREDVTVLPLDAFRELVGPQCNPFLTIAVSGTLAPGGLRFATTGIHDGVPHERPLATIDYLRHLQDRILLAGADRDDAVQLIFQSEDVPAELPSVSWEAKRGWDSVALIPDIYYFHAGGYEGFAPEQVPWAERRSIVVWRGSTTGLFYQKLDDLDRLPRYRLCHIATRLGSIADVGLSAVVQAFDAEHEQLIADRLRREGLLKPFVPMTEMTRYRYILDIDGNSNSWNFMSKLRLGCCVLRVDSEWQQWFGPRLLPWVHYVPVAQDLSDVAGKVGWCLDHEEECAAIAQRGADFARTMRFDDEMAAAARTAFALA